MSRRALAQATLAACAGGCSRPKRGGHEISLWFTYGGNNRTVLLELVERFNQTHSIRVVPTFQGDYFEGLVKLRTGMFVGSIPTVTHVIGEVVPYLAEAGVLAELDLGDVALDPPLSQHGSFRGGEDQPLYALPFNRSTPIAYYNKAWFERLGLKPPTTWDELVAVARACTERSGDETAKWGFECPIAWWFWLALVGQAGGEVIEGSEVTLGGRAGVEALALWQRLVHEERVMKPPPGRDYNAWEATNNDFLAQRVAMIWTSTAFLRYLEDNASFAVGAAPLPKQQRFAVPTGGTFFVMPKAITGAERDAGMRFLRWMMAPEQANEWATKTGYMPVNLDGRAQLEGFFAERPNFRVSLSQLEHALPMPWSADLFRVQREVVQPRLEEAVLTGRDAGAVLAEAVEAAREP